MKNPEKNLRFALKINAAFSLTSGLTLIIFTESIALLMDVAHSLVLLFVGVGLIAFAGSVFYNATKRDISAQQVKFIIVQDWAWIAGSAVLLVFNPFEISFAGNIAIGVVAVVVMAFAVAQSKALTRMNTNVRIPSASAEEKNIRGSNIAS